MRFEIVGLWTKKAETAEQEKGKALNIYGLKMEKGWSTFPSMKTPTLVQSASTAPTLAAIRLTLVKGGKAAPGK